MTTYWKAARPDGTDFRSLSWNEAPGDVPGYDDAPAEDSTAAPEDVEVRS